MFLSLEDGGVLEAAVKVASHEPQTEHRVCLPQSTRPSTPALCNDSARLHAGTDLHQARRTSSRRGRGSSSDGVDGSKEVGRHASFATKLV